jgi:chromosome segregation and condensation protein ScpB
MNANELADKLLGSLTMEYDCDKYMEQAATMLRQQQAELTEAGGMIGVLREQLQEEIQARADALDDLNNRMMKFMKSYNEMAYKLEEVGGAYTHPAKELTDEEIGQIWKDCMESQYMQVSNPVGFARAILRKAQNG